MVFQRVSMHVHEPTFVVVTSIALEVVPAKYVNQAIREKKMHEQVRNEVAEPK